MAEIKTTKIKRLISFTDAQHDMLRKIMEQDGLDSYSVAIGNLIADESKKRGYNALPIIKV